LRTKGFSRGRRAEIDLELDGENFFVRFGQRHGSISGCCVRNRRDRPTMNEIMLLEYVRTIAQTDFDPARLNKSQFGAKKRHQRLA